MPNQAAPTSSIAFAYYTLGKAESLHLQSSDTDRVEQGKYFQIMFDRGQGIVVLIFNDPERFNSMTPALMDDMRQAMGFLRGSELHIRTVVLQGNGKHFCVGANHYHEVDISTN